MRTSNLVDESNVFAESLMLDVVAKKTTGTSNGKINFVCGKFDAFAATRYGNEKDGRKLVEDVSKGKGLAPSQSFAFAELQRAQEEFNRQISYNINKIFEADKVVTALIEEMSKTDGADFFTADFLRKYGLYKIPCGVILDTLQRCKSFVSSLYAAAYKAYQEEIKRGNSVDVAVTLCEKRIKEHNNGWMSTKWDALNTLGKMRVLAPVIFWNWYAIKGQPIPENAVRYTHTEQVLILRKLGVSIRLKGRKFAPKNPYIEIEEYKPQRFGVSYNFDHEYAENAKPLSEEDKAKVLSTPVTLLKEEDVTKEEDVKRTKRTKRKTTK